jgi:hypothetical protein
MPGALNPTLAWIVGRATLTIVVSGTATVLTAVHAGQRGVYRARGLWGDFVLMHRSTVLKTRGTAHHEDFT